MIGLQEENENFTTQCFRLLNSEIGNDHQQARKKKNLRVFSSP